MQHNYILTAEFQNKENKEDLTHRTQGFLSMRLTVNPLENLRAKHYKNW